MVKWCQNHEMGWCEFLWCKAGLCVFLCSVLISRGFLMHLSISVFEKDSFWYSQVELNFIYMLVRCVTVREKWNKEHWSVSLNRCFIWLLAVSANLSWGKSVSLCQEHACACYIFLLEPGKWWWGTRAGKMWTHSGCEAMSAGLLK